MTEPKLGAFMKMEKAMTVCKRRSDARGQEISERIEKSRAKSARVPFEKRPL